MLEALKKTLVTERSKKILKTSALAVLGTTMIVSVLFFSLRNVVLRSVLESRIRSYQGQHTGAVLRIGSAKFSGLAGIDLENVQMHTATGDFAASLSKCSIQLSFLKLFTGRVQLSRLALNDLSLDFHRETALGPSPTFKSGQDVPAPLAKFPGRAPDFGARAAQLLDIYFTRIPDSLEIERFTIHSSFNDIRQALYIPHLVISGPAFSSTLEVFDQGKKWACLMTGNIERGKKRLQLRLLPRHDKGPATLPFVERQWGLRVDFTSLAVGLHSRGRKSGILRLDGSLALTGLTFNHTRIAAKDVELENAALDYSLGIGPDTIELVEPSAVTFNRLSFRPRVTLHVRPTRQLALKIPETRFAADDLFASLPTGLFTSLAGIRTGGELAFQLDVAIDLARPEELELDVNLEKSNFHIRHFGSVDFRTINAPFLYTVFERDRAQHSFLVGPENPDFRSLDRIPSCLKHSVMISEDGAFFSHRGFLLEPFKNSIVANLKAGRFVRGASTISMQLVKNLFLRRHKTIARKLEEMLITWLIEENRLVAKERMFEIYLNIIEWGPGIYGAQQAARYYFNKDVEELTLAEAIFMASIIPRPKKFMYSFDQEQCLRPWLQAYYRDVSVKMLQREWISQQDLDTLIAAVQLSGPARFLLKGNENLPAETLDIIEETEERP